MPTGLEIAGLAAAAIGSAVSAVSAVAGGYQQADALEYNARVSEMNAAAARDAAALDEQNSRLRTARVQGQVRARAAGAGLEINQGSPLEVLAQNASEGELDALTARYAGTVAASRAQSQAALDRSRASGAITSGWIGAGAQLLSSGSKAYAAYGPFGGSGGDFNSAGVPRAAPARTLRPWGDV